MAREGANIVFRGGEGTGAAQVYGPSRLAQEGTQGMLDESNRQKQLNQGVAKEGAKAKTDKGKAQPGFGVEGWYQDQQDLNTMLGGYRENILTNQMKGIDPLNPNSGQAYLDSQRFQDMAKAMGAKSIAQKEYYDKAISQYLKDPEQYPDEYMSILNEWKNTPLQERNDVPILPGKKKEPVDWFSDLYKYNPVTGKTKDEDPDTGMVVAGNYYDRQKTNEFLDQYVATPGGKALLESVNGDMNDYYDAGNAVLRSKFKSDRSTTYQKPNSGFDKQNMANASFYWDKVRSIYDGSFFEGSSGLPGGGVGSDIAPSQIGGKANETGLVKSGFLIDAPIGYYDATGKEVDMPDGMSPEEMVNWKMGKGSDKMQKMTNRINSWELLDNGKVLVHTTKNPKGVEVDPVELMERFFVSRGAGGKQDFAAFLEVGKRDGYIDEEGKFKMNKPKLDLGIDVEEEEDDFGF